MTALSDRIAAEHWFTLHEGWHCVGCGYSDIGRGEDYGAASRRHLADVTERAVRDSIAQQLEQAQSSVFYPTCGNPNSLTGKLYMQGVGAGIECATLLAREGTTP